MKGSALDKFKLYFEELPNATRDKLLRLHKQKKQAQKNT